MTSRTNRHADGQDQADNLAAPLAARQLRRHDAGERYLAGAPIAAICRELGCSRRWVYQWKHRYEASDPT
jgi:hypothetical protein